MYTRPYIYASVAPNSYVSRVKIAVETNDIYGRYYSPLSGTIILDY